MRIPVGRRDSLAKFVMMALAVTLLWVSPVMAATLDHIRESKVIRIAYREDAPPFSYKGADGQPTGFMIDLCRMVAQRIAQQLKVADLTLVYVPVTAADRFDAIKQARADLLCEATTATLTRREVVDFSLPTFVDGASLMVRAGAPDDLKGMAGRKIGVLGGTTTELALRNALQRAAVNAEVVLMDSHPEAISQLDDGRIVAYFADRAILMSLARDSKAPDQIRIAEQYLTVEPYALAMSHGDNAFRLAVDRALSHIYRSSDIVRLFQRAFGVNVNQSQLLHSLYVAASLPD
ncbi:amino acid ABC transporter substrate-binding protein [Vineibacter terrae]|uniref:Amino acid ABC transporter substrate-binding protein n=2 Tax=Vineibacter terrae TaxID=2586908 RepID=A0A5C8PQZ7_9HYPH|nr:amino acid ABC transporter substrate-binding protein [Vineibacter terrae]